MSSILFTGAFIHSSQDAFATSLLVEDGVIAWLGDEDSSASFASRADRVIDLDGALIAPAFVDTHVHLLETALSRRAVDVSPRRGGTSVHEVLALIDEQARMWAPDRGVVCATGYDDTEWDSSGLSGAMLDERWPGVPIYVPRADLHSAIASVALLEHCGLSQESLDAGGRLAGAAHTVVRDAIRDLPLPAKIELYAEILRYAAEQGIVAVHENSAPGIDTRDGLAQLILMTQSPADGLPQVVGYRGELIESEQQLDLLKTAIPGLAGCAGDLSVDGSFGSHSAALRAPYADKPTTSGTLHLSQAQIERHLEVCSLAGVQAGFHVIGDAALDVVLEATQAVASKSSALKSALRRCGHRIEHAEMVDADAIGQLIQFGFSVSVQPAFDAFWGGVGGMYEQRLGTQRMQQTTPIRSFLKEGVPMGFGSDAPVTPLDPWGAISAALFHRNPEHRVSARAAFKAHTRGGWRIAGEHNPLVGEIRIGAPAHLAVWRSDELGVQAENQGRSSWLTDSRSGTPLLPILEEDAIDQGIRPTCLATLREGVFLFDALN